jgi:hypothetical protein
MSISQPQPPPVMSTAATATVAEIGPNIAYEAHASSEIAQQTANAGIGTKF